MELEAAVLELDDLLARVPDPALDVARDDPVEADPDVARIALDQAEGPLGDLRRVVVLGVVEALTAQPGDVAEGVEREGAQGLVAVAVADEVEPLLVDEEGVGIEEEAALAAAGPGVGDLEAVLLDQRRDDVVDVVDPPLVAVRRLAAISQWARNH